MNTFKSTIATAEKRRTRKELAIMEMLKLLKEGIAPVLMDGHQQEKARKKNPG